MSEAIQAADDSFRSIICKGKPPEIIKILQKMAMVDKLPDTKAQSKKLFNMESCTYFHNHHPILTSLLQIYKKQQP